MREIKFRAWDKSRQHPCMIEVEALMYDEFDKMSICGKPFDEDNGGFTHLEEGEFDLIQYTGLKDNNGVEIYEGDIFKPLYNKLGNYIVTFKNGRFNISDFSHSQCKIIGNIHQHPELIEA